MQNIRFLPPVHQLQSDKRFVKLLATFNLDKEVMTTFVQEQLNLLRNELLQQQNRKVSQSREELIHIIFQRVEQSCLKLTSYYLRRVINATGTILHTNLGRARLSKPAIEHVLDVAANYSNLEYYIEERSRGSRHTVVEDLLKRITGAGSAMVVNNNAAAVYLILRTFAKNKEVIVSRGQLVEIGGSFRISAIMKESDAQLVEVGTTNKTHLYDYEDAIDENTAMIMKVHTSNFKTIGFTESVETEELVKLKLRYENILYYEDLGSGVLFDFQKYGIGDEPVVKEIIKKGADLVSFSGDKLLGGPQAGIILGKAELIKQLKKHQLARVLRVDKMTLAALEATLMSYLKGEHAIEDIPTIRDIIAPIEKIKERAEKFIPMLKDRYHLVLEEGFSQIGGGTMPDVEIPTYVVLLSHSEIKSEIIATRLRKSTPSIITRMKQNHLIFDFRTIQDDEIEIIAQALIEIN